MANNNIKEYGYLITFPNSYGDIHTSRTNFFPSPDDIIDYMREKWGNAVGRRVSVAQLSKGEFLSFKKYIVCEDFKLRPYRDGMKPEKLARQEPLGMGRYNIDTNLIEELNLVTSKKGE